MESEQLTEDRSRTQINEPLVSIYCVHLAYIFLKKGKKKYLKGKQIHTCFFTKYLPTQKYPVLVDLNFGYTLESAEELYEAQMPGPDQQILI